MEEVEFVGTVLAWFLLCITIGIFEIKLISTYEKKEAETLKILFEKISYIAKTNEKVEFRITLPKIGSGVTRIERVNESAIQISAPFCENVTIIFNGGVNVSLNGQNISLTRKF